MSHSQTTQFVIFPFVVNFINRNGEQNQITETIFFSYCPLKNEFLLTKLASLLLCTTIKQISEIKIKMNLI